MLLITGDRELDIGAYEKNAYLQRMMNTLGHQDNKLYELDGFSHNRQLAEAAFPLLLNEEQRITKAIDNDQ